MTPNVTTGILVLHNDGCNISENIAGKERSRGKVLLSTNVETRVEMCILGGSIIITAHYKCGSKHWKVSSSYISQGSAQKDNRHLWRKEANHSKSLTHVTVRARRNFTNLENIHFVGILLQHSFTGQAKSRRC